jgi:selenocysteine lyase/cysteine desulfurase
MCCNWEFGANLTDSSDWQSEKQALPNTSVEGGTTNSRRALAEKADSSIRFKRAFGSNATDTSERQFAKHDRHRTSTVAGMTICVNPDPQNVSSWIRCNCDSSSNQM